MDDSIEAALASLLHALPCNPHIIHNQATMVLSPSEDSHITQPTCANCQAHTVIEIRVHQWSLCVCVPPYLPSSLPLSLSSLGFPMPFVCAKLLPFCCCNCNWNCKVSLLHHACHRRRRSLSSLRARFGIGFVKVNCMQYCAFFLSLQLPVCCSLCHSPHLSLSLSSLATFVHQPVRPAKTTHRVIWARKLRH